MNEYKSEAFALFNAMLDELKERVTSVLAQVELSVPDSPPPDLFQPRPQPMYENHPEAALGYTDGDTDVLERPAPLSLGGARSQSLDPADPATWRNVSRNAPCPCGSGKKYKHCHGRTA